MAGARVAPIVALRAWVRHEPRHARELAEFIGCPVEAGAADDGFVLRRDVLDERPRLSNPVLWNVLREAAVRELTRVRAPSLVDRVRTQLSLGLERRSGAGLSARSLAKQLPT